MLKIYVKFFSSLNRLTLINLYGFYLKLQVTRYLNYSDDNIYNFKVSMIINR